MITGLHTSSVPTEMPVPPAAVYEMGGAYGIELTVYEVVWPAWKGTEVSVVQGVEQGKVKSAGAIMLGQPGNCANILLMAMHNIAKKNRIFFIILDLVLY